MIKPGDLELEEFRRVGYEVIDAIAAYHERLDARPVLPRTTRADVAARFTDEFAEYGEPAEALLADWRERVAPLLTTIGSPRHFAYVNGSGAMVGVFAEALAAAVNTNAGAWKLGPAATEIERQVLRWIAGFVGYPEDAGGILVSGGTMANFTAILTALRHVAPYDSTPHGLQDRARRGRFLIYMSDHEGHISVTRVADMLNLGRESVRLVPSRADFTIDPEALDRMIGEDRARGDLPFCVVAQLGSVNVGAVDPIDALADICEKHGVWLHGDGAIGLLAAALPETASLFRGLARADSLSFDAHKWLGVPNDCGVVLVRHAERLRRAFSITAPYLREPRDAHDVDFDFLEYGPQMSRGFRALKVWMVLRFFGAAGVRELIAKNIGLARRLHALVRDHPDFEVLHEPVLSIYSFRFVPHQLGAAEDAAEWIDRLNCDIAAEIQRSGLALLMTTRIRGRIALRMSICSQRTLEEDIDTTFDAIAAAGRRLAALQPVAVGE
ncbi:MAG TPA: aminotransferase class V-fold PLP-dependent enzyme [Thermoanaerobaculia bacterium]|nr:aminotransferase class V-fold PLP-dependent enzyme [Thermoanaerobaculia bacterium]